MLFRSGKLLPYLFAAAAAALAYGLYLVFFVAPPDYQQGETVKIMYIHVPAAWLSMMGYSIAALSSFGLRGVAGGLGPIHLLSLLVLVMIPRGVLLARRHRIEAHRRVMSLTYLGLAGAALFTLLPGRLLGSWLFS